MTVKGVARWEVIAYRGTVVVMALGVLLTLCRLFAMGPQLEENAYLSIIITLIGMIAACLLYFFNFTRMAQNDRQIKIFSTAVAMIYLELLLYSVIAGMEGFPEHKNSLLALQTEISLVNSLLHLLLWYYYECSIPFGKRRRRVLTIWMWCIELVHALFTVVNLFTREFFYVAEDGFLRYPGEWVDTSLSLLFYLCCLAAVLSVPFDRRRKLILSSFAAAPMLCILLCLAWMLHGYRYYFDALPHIASLLSAFLVFFSIFLEDREELFRHRAELAEREQEQTRLGTAVMLSQIGPHFLYNTLATISALCRRENAMETKQAVDTFAGYLRANLSALSDTPLIPFDRELEHIRTYLWLEELRFGEELHTVYDIGCTDFLLPPLTVEPLVENAVTHGILQKRGGGTVCLTTGKTDEAVVITVSDDGVGFDLAAPANDGREHVGIDNVRKRLSALCGGTLDIQSAPGQGTTVTVRIPK